MSEPDYHYAIIVDPEKGHIEYHRFTLELPHRKHIGRAIKSYNSFRCAGNPKRGAPYDIILRDQGEFSFDMQFAWKSKMPFIPLYVHDTIWDFYNFVGYDYKRRCFDQDLYDNARKHRSQQPQDSRICFAAYVES